MHKINYLLLLAFFVGTWMSAEASGVSDTVIIACQGDNVTLCSDGMPSGGTWYQGNGTSNPLSNDSCYTFVAQSNCTIYYRIPGIFSSYRKFTIVVNYPTTVEQTVTACDHYYWQRNGVTYDSSTIFTITGYPDGNGCDSVITLRLTIYYSQHSDTSVTACGSFYWHGGYYYNGGQYVHNWQGDGPCINSDTLNLTVNHTTCDTLRVDTCDSYRWPLNNHTYFYSVTTQPRTTGLLNTQGCDSLQLLILNIRRSSHVSFVESVCDSIVWNNNTFFTDTLHTLILTNAAGCDSVLTLNLTVRHSTEKTRDTVVCDSLVWNGSTYGVSTVIPTIRIPGGNSQGCDSLIGLRLTVIYSENNELYVTECESYTWHGFEYRESCTLTHDSLIANLCPLHETLHLTILGVSVPESRQLKRKYLGQGWPMMLIYPRKEGEKDYYYQWYKGDNVISGSTKQYLPLKEASEIAGVYRVWVSSQDMSMCGSWSSDTIGPLNSPSSILSITPNPVESYFTISLQSTEHEAVSAELFNEVGQSVVSIPMQNNMVSIESPLSNGIYTVLVRTKTGELFVGKVIKR